MRQGGKGLEQIKWEGRGGKRERERGNGTEETAKLFAESRMKRGAVEEVPESVREPLREGDRVEW